ncbi:MAG: DUF4326 domain-containing protein [Actinomycetota bacterium]|nr:DUF4326 domain-containing protein [Actinomycetota bacterium]
MPERIQRKRTQGWRMPEGAVYVGRPTKFGNPFEVFRTECCGFWDVRDDNGVAYLVDHRVAHDLGGEPWSRAFAQGEAVRLFAEDLTHWFGGSLKNDEGLASAITGLAGHDLACWCPLDVPCHADVLLELANGGA